MSAHGVLYVHSAPPALCPHIEWAVAGIVGAPVGMPWVGQPAAPGALRAELTWHARPGTAGAVASALAGWNRLRFEVTEDSSPGCDGVRHCYTPDLGLFSAVTGANGDIMVSEDRLRSVMLLAWMGQSSHGVVTVRLGLPAASARTIYDQLGDYVPWSALAIVVMAALVMFANSRGFPGRSAGVKGGHEAQYVAGQSVPS